MNKSQRVILGVGLIVLAVVLHFSLCKWTDSPVIYGSDFGPPSDTVVFGWLYVRAGVSMLTGVLIGIVAPIIGIIAGVFVMAKDAEQ